MSFIAYFVGDENVTNINNDSPPQVGIPVILYVGYGLSRRCTLYTVENVTLVIKDPSAAATTGVSLPSQYYTVLLRPRPDPEGL